MGHTIKIGVLALFALISIAFSQSCDNSLPACEGITCGVSLNVRFDNKTTICDCTQDDMDVHFTECQDNKRTAFFFYKPPAVCLNGKLPAPIYDIPCDYECSNGNFYNTNTTTCDPCEKGTYSLPTKMSTFNTWNVMPPQFTTSCERITQGSGGCQPWVPRGDWIDSGNNRINNNIRSALEYKFEVKEEYLTLSFSYQVSAELNWDYFVFMLDDNQVLKTSQQTWQTFTINVTSGYHVAKWIYTKDPSISYGEDQAKIRFISLTGPNKIAFNCPKCKAGEYSDGTHACKKCPAGTYSDQDGSVECKTCPAFHSSYAGSTKCFVDSVPCTSADYYSYRSPCDPGTNNQVTHYKWIQPRMCNETATGSVTLPQDSTGACQARTCKPGQKPNDLGFCDYCPEGQSGNGNTCAPCDSGRAASSKHLVYDRWVESWPAHFNTTCFGDCRSNGWRLVGDYIDSGVGNGVSDSVFGFSFDIVNDTNINGFNRAVALDYALSCEDSTVQVWLDGFLATSVHCYGCNDLSQSKKLTIPWVPPGHHYAFIDFKTLSLSANDTFSSCNKMIVNSVTVLGAAQSGGAAECQTCHSGTFAKDSKQCATCPAGTKSGERATECTSCEPNTFSPPRSDQCYNCGKGTASNGNAAECYWKAGTCKYHIDATNRTYDLNGAAKQLAESKLACLSEPGTEFYMNLCGDVAACNAINAKVCKYVPLTDDWVNLGNAVDVTNVASTEYGPSMMAITLTNYQSVCRNNATGVVGPIQTSIRMTCDPNADATGVTTVSKDGDCKYDYLISSRAACPLCTDADWSEVEGNCDPVTLQLPVRYVKNATGLVVTPVSCYGGVDKSKIVLYRACTIPLPVAAWIPITIVAVFIALLLIAAVVIVILYKKFRDVSMKYKQFVDETDEQPARRRGGVELEATNSAE